MDLEEIVGAAGIPEESILILAIFVAGAEPLADESVFCFLWLIPVTGAEGIAFDPGSPISFAAAGRPDSSAIFASNPGRILPLEPGFTSPGRLEMTM